MATLQEIIARLETYGFECQAGPLENCVDWHTLTARCAKLEEALKTIAGYAGDNGCCPYGCDTPFIARQALLRWTTHD